MNYQDKKKYSSTSTNMLSQTKECFVPLMNNVPQITTHSNKPKVEGPWSDPERRSVKRKLWLH